MYRHINIIISATVLAFISYSAAAQDMESVLESVERNNVQLQSLRAANDAAKLETKMQNNLGDPSIEYSPFWAKGTDGISSSELVVSYGFDFPTQYVSRSRAGKLQRSAIDGQYQVERRNVLLQAKKLCLDIVFLSRKRELLSDRLGKKTAYMLSLLVAAVLSLFILILPVSTPGGLWTLMVLQVLISVATGVTLPLLWSMFADIADYSEYRNSSASTGLIFSSSSMAQKFGGAFGSALILWALAGFGYDTSETAVQTTDAIGGLKAMMSWIPALGAFIAAGVVAFYPLTTSRMKEISAALAARRSGQHSGSNA